MFIGIESVTGGKAPQCLRNDTKSSAMQFDPTTERSKSWPYLNQSAHRPLIIVSKTRAATDGVHLSFNEPSSPAIMKMRTRFSRITMSASC